jgi:hypothetical protein
MAAKAKKKVNLKPLKLEADIYAKNVDENGETIGEINLGRIQIYAPLLPKAATIIADALPVLIAEAEKQLET